MREYELMVVFPLEEDKYKTASDAVRKILTGNDAQVKSEEPYGDRDLAYEIKKHTRGRYVLFTLGAQPDKILDMDHQLKLTPDILTYLFIRKDE
ncbi:MAG: 30S ribosomal protein S6 [Spirochaetes bacterium]|uniref:Small ribosomal subunit protein bS6 n=1 Tax=Candidatus Avitreponema avistercoris TaxID=2840705 RepID=A0A9D9EML7_9SPIR|nr:30S ribosomal protein S6 [Candidatus Avitreponema avistercoris]